jgi:multiple sugar transport system substrate-binding protein
MKQFRIGVGLSALAALALAAPLVSSLAQSQKQTITYMFWGGQTEYDLSKKLVETFTTDNPGIEVKLQQVDSDTYEQKLLVQIAAGNAPDVMVIRDASSSFLARRGLFSDLTPLMQKFKFDSASLDAATVKNYRLGAQQYGLPRGVSPILMYYNKAMFDAAGVAYPKEGWKWADFLAAAKKLTRDTNKDGKIDQWGTFMTPWDALFLPFVYTFGGDLVNADGTKSTLLQPETVSAFSYTNDLINTYKVAPPLPEAEAFGWIDGWAQQKYAMIFQGRWATPIFLEAMEKIKAPFVFNVAPVPQGKLRKTVEYSDAVGIAKTSKNQEAAFKWIAFLMSEKGQAGFGGPRSLSVPSNLKVARTLIAPNALPEAAELFISEAKYGAPPPQTPSFSAFYAILNRHLKEIFLKLKPVRQGLTEADKEINEMLKKSYDSLK